MKIEPYGYGLIGEHLSHSYSREIHESLGRYAYTLQEIPPEELADFFKTSSFQGINVTIPYKKAVMDYLDELDSSARSVGTCNCIVRQNNQLIGYNTDYDGIAATFTKNGISPQGKKVLILGQGGVAAAYKAYLKDQQAAEILIAYYKEAPGTISYEEAAGHRDVQIVINATPVGMYPHIDDLPLSLDSFDQLEFVVDPIYNPFMTRLLMEASRRGIPFENGLWMLVVQAIVAAGHFLQEQPAMDKALAIWEKLRKDRVNIALIGMPTSGKSTLGTLLAQALERPLVELDEEIVKEIGMPIADYFALYGEPAFRKVEKEITARYAAQSSQILSCGGGVILDEDNIRHLQANSILVYLDRDLNLLARYDASRPTLQQGLEQLYARRRPLYEKAADLIIPNNTTPQEALHTLLKKLEESATYRRMDAHDYYSEENRR